MTVDKCAPSDSPPPYSETSSTSAPPPDYHTISEQPGFLAEEPVQQSPKKKRNPLLHNISYDKSHGPIGNILNMAETIVGNAANAANIALGATASTSPIDLGANAARSATLIANNASKTALDIVEGFLNKREGRKERREHRNERRESRRDNSEGEASSSSSTKVPYQPYKPQCSNNSTSGDSLGEHSFNERNTSRHNSSEGSSTRSCRSGSGERENTSDYDSNSERKLEIIKSNEPLELNESWSGVSCHLKTTNAPLTSHGSLSATDKILLENSNGSVVVEGQLLASNTVCIKSSNGAFIVRGESIIANYVDVQTKNAPLQINSFIQAKHISFKTKNAPINLGNISLGEELTVKTSNASIDIHILDIASKSAKIKVETSNGPVNVYVPSNFSGYFSVKSNAAGSVKVVAKSSEHATLKYEVDENSKKEGACKYMDNKSNIEIEISTSNAAAILYI